MKKGKKKGASAPTETRPSRIDRELWFFGENRLALWQPVLYFNPHSPFSNTGDLLILRILEGTECAPREQQPNLTLNADSMAQIAERYAAQLAQQLNLQLKFHRVRPAEARYLLLTSAELIANEDRARPLTDVLRFVNPEPKENLFEKIPEAQS
ncbi:MAG TPA: hypothetical protein VLH08_20280, partial [Acidobacteriota bacterium]|nr:hypothetical protein [Acidobacteriota bacterium]